MKPQTISHAARARYRAMVRRELAAGADPRALARKWGYSERYIKQIAQDAGLNRPIGRPRGSSGWPECPPQFLRRYNYLVYEKGLPPADAREVVEERLL